MCSGSFPFSPWDVDVFHCLTTSAVINEWRDSGNSIEHTDDDKIYIMMDCWRANDPLPPVLLLLLLFNSHCSVYVHKKLQLKTKKCAQQTETRIHSRIVVYMVEKILLTTHIMCWTCFIVAFYQSGNVNIKSSGVFEVKRGDYVRRNKRHTFKGVRFVRRKRNNNPSFVFTLFATRWFSPLHVTLLLLNDFSTKIEVFHSRGFRFYKSFNVL